MPSATNAFYFRILSAYKNSVLVKVSVRTGITKKKASLSRRDMEEIRKLVRKQFARTPSRIFYGPCCSLFRISRLLGCHREISVLGK